MRPQASKKKIDLMPPEKRLELAQDKTRRLLDFAISNMVSYANSQHLVYSDTISKQIPKSYAANAFKALQHDLMQFQVIKVCRVWENLDLDGYNFKTIEYLIDDLAVKRLIYELHIQNYISFSSSVANNNASTVLTFLGRFQRSIKHVLESSELANVQNFRHKLAHNIEQTSSEKQLVVPNPKVQNLIWLAKKTVINIERLNRILRSSNFDWRSSGNISRKYANALWLGVNVKVLE